MGLNDYDLDETMEREIMKDKKADVEVRNEGTIFLFTPLSERAEEWIEENVADDATWFGRALVVEHRFARDLADGMIEAGLEVV